MTGSSGKSFQVLRTGHDGHVRGYFFLVLLGSSMTGHYESWPAEDIYPIFNCLSSLVCYLCQVNCGCTICSYWLSPSTAKDK